MSRIAVFQDEAVIATFRTPRLILTEDKDFGEWVFAHDIRDIAASFFCATIFRDTAELLATLLELLRTGMPDLLRVPSPPLACVKFSLRRL
ncbi:MAG: hypothetical protein WKG07_34725 [Hymenobacter sp.]